MPDAATTHPTHPPIRVFLSLGAKLSELHEVPIAVMGTWVKNGKRFSISDSDLTDIVRNFQKRKNGRVVVDYEHASEMPAVAGGREVPAAGWVRAMEVRGGTLFASIEWTTKAQQLIEAREYQYLSPAIDWGAESKETGEPQGATLTSVALTNHPFLEELPSLMLSEVALADEDSDKIIHVPIPEGDGDYKVKVKVQKKEPESEKAEMADRKNDDECPEDNEKYGEVDLAEQTDEDHAKVGSGDSVHRSDFAYVGDPDKKETWKYPIHDASHVRNALARWGQHKGIPSDKEPGVLAKIKRAANKFGVEYDKEKFGEVKEMADQELKDKGQAVDVAEKRGGAQDQANLKDSGVDDQQKVAEKLRKEAEKHAEDSKDAHEDDADDAVLADTEVDEDGEPKPKIPRLKIRGMKSKDSVGKLRHHAVMDDSGKLLGYVRHSDFMEHAARYQKAPDNQTVTARMSEAELLADITGRPIDRREVSRMINFAIENEDEIKDRGRRRKAVELFMNECLNEERPNKKRARRLFAENRVSHLDFVDFEDACEEIDRFVKIGKVGPGAYRQAVKAFLTDSQVFQDFMEAQPPFIHYGVQGIGGTGAETESSPDVAVNREVAKVRQKDKDKSYTEALKQVLSENPDLAERYNEHHRQKLM